MAEIVSSSREKTMAHHRIGQEAWFATESPRSSLDAIAELIDWSLLEARWSVV